MPDVSFFFKKQTNPLQNSIPFMQERVKATPETAVLWVYVALYIATLSDSPDRGMSAEKLSGASDTHVTARRTWPI